MAMLAGSELVTYNLARAMKRKGHDVVVYSPNIGGLLEQKCKQAEIELVRKLGVGHPNCKKPDVIHAHHHDPTAQVVSVFPDVPVVFTLHGIIRGAETVPEVLKKKKNVIYVAVSEEVQALLKHADGVESEIIRQGIDFDRFKSEKPINDEIKTALLSTSYLEENHPFVENFKKACGVRGIKAIAIGRAFNWTWETEKAYNDADIVLAIGRGVLEAMACGRPAITYGHWGHGEILSSEEMKDAKKYNFSGRHIRDEYFGWKEILKAFKGYHPLRSYRKLAANYKLSDKVEEYLKLYRRVTKILPKKKVLTGSFNTDVSVNSNPVANAK